MPTVWAKIKQKYKWYNLIPALWSESTLNPGGGNNFMNPFEKAEPVLVITLQGLWFSSSAAESSRVSNY